MYQPLSTQSHIHTESYWISVMYLMVNISGGTFVFWLFVTSSWHSAPLSPFIQKGDRRRRETVLYSVGFDSAWHNQLLAFSLVYIATCHLCEMSLILPQLPKELKCNIFFLCTLYQGDEIHFIKNKKYSGKFLNRVNFNQWLVTKQCGVSFVNPCFILGGLCSDHIRVTHG